MRSGSVVYNALCAVHGVHFVVHGAWWMVHGAWCMVHGGWCTEHGAASCTVRTVIEHPHVALSVTKLIEPRERLRSPVCTIPCTHVAIYSSQYRRTMRIVGEDCGGHALCLC